MAFQVPKEGGIIAYCMGRGTLYLTAATVLFALSGYVVHFGLGRYLGPEEYGTFGVILSLMGTVSLLLTSGVPDGVSKYIAEDEARLSLILRSSRWIQAVFSVVVFGLYFGLAGPIAKLLHDPDLTPYIRVSALVIPAYAYFYIHYGCLNGLRLFGKQAKTLGAVAVARVGIVFVLILLGFGVKGAIVGYVLAAVAGLLLAVWYLGRIDRKSAVPFEWRSLVRFSFPATLFAVMFFMLTNVDLLAVKGLVPEGVDTGYYAAAATIARLPCFVFAGVGLVLLPSVSNSVSRADTGLTATYIGQSMRYLLMLLVPAVVLVSATSTDLVSLIYSGDYANAGEPLALLAFGLGLLTVFRLLATIMMGAGKPLVALGLALPTVGLDVALNVLLVPEYGLIGAAWATTISAIAGTLVGGAYVLARFNALVSLKSFVRICLASSAIYAIVHQVSVSLYFLPLLYVALFGVYLCLLVLMKEFTRADVEAFRRIFALPALSKAGAKPYEPPGV